MDTPKENENIIELHIKPETMTDEELEGIYAYADKRKRITWTQEELETLKKGIKKFGKGKWKEILEFYKDDFRPERRMKDLCDKYRCVENGPTGAKHPHKFFWEVDNESNPICVNGEKVLYKCKHPHQAARYCAFSKSFKENVNIIIRIAYEENEKLWIHIYVARYNNGSAKRKSINVRKLAGQSPYRRDGM
ncbi:myb-like DNA-binding domain-containing protein [Vairimorpha necatrix]|uniref:Myb-like DNA-binding domain-containing protein n=1 Tax=Vairimorpha necatrix TaxID=6039 RepID=A0AAX4JCZ8_9MICR